MAFISGNLLFSLRYRLEGVGEEVVAQARVRQYYGANGPEYYPLLDWQALEGSGEQELQIPIDRERVARGGRTYVEWRFARRGGGKFDEKSLVSLEALAVDRTRWGWYTRTVLSCEQEDNYRYGFNGQEKVNEIAGVGNHNTALFWEYDTRLGRRWNLDPVDQISISNYAANRNNPIWFNDPLGDFSKVGAQWRNFVNDGKGVSYTKSTGEWGYTKGVGGGASYRDGLSKGVRRDRIDNYGKGHAYTRPSAEQQIGKLYEPVIRVGEWFQNLGDRHLHVSNEEWYGGGNWEGDRMWEQKGKPLAIATVKFHLAWGTAGMGGYAVSGGTAFRNFAGMVTWGGIGFGADGVADAASEGAHSIKAAVGNKFGKPAIMVYDAGAVAVDIMSLRLGIKPMMKGENMASFPANSVIATDDVATGISDANKKE